MAASCSGVRPASAQDAAACLAIYRPYAQNTAISWEIDIPTVGEMAARIEGLRATHEASNGFHRSFGFTTPACTGGWHGSTTWHGCNSTCLTPAARMDRRARFADPQPATSGPLRNRQRAMSSSTGFAKVEPWTRRPPAVHLDP